MSYLQQGFSRHSDSVKSSQNPSPIPLHIRIKIRLEVYYGMLIQMIKLCHFKLDCKSILMFIKDVERAICWSSCTITELSWDRGARVWPHCWPALCIWSFMNFLITSNWLLYEGWEEAKDKPLHCQICNRHCEGNLAQRSRDSHKHTLHSLSLTGSRWRS